MITDPEIERYIAALQPPRDQILTEMEEYARQHDIPIVGPLAGRFLAQLVMISGARRIFELGSAIGYSTLWLARAAGPGAEVHYTDLDPDNAARARTWFDRAGVAGRIRIHVGDALAALDSVEGRFDFVFNDVDKEQYLEVLSKAVSRLDPGGLFVSDNALWHERVLSPRDAASKVVAEFNRKLFEHKEFFTTLVPLRDGLLIARKR